MNEIVYIRDAEPNDEAEWRRLWDGYLVFYETTLGPEITTRT